MLRVCVLLGALAMAAAAGAAEPTSYPGTCDASGAIALSNDAFVVADDESDVLRIYSRAHPEVAPKEVDVDGFLRLDDGTKEADLEGAAQIGNRIYWITSHGRNEKGELKKKRFRLFATEVSQADGQFLIRPVGTTPYTKLVDALLVDARYAELSDAAKPNVEVDPAMAPKKGKGLNIEGLAATPQGALLIGLRTPLTSDNRALIIPLRNPGAVVAGKAPEFGDPIRLDLSDGAAHLGIRSIDYVGTGDKGAYYIVAGPAGEGDPFVLFRWSGDPKAAPQRLRQIEGLRPEALFVFPDSPGQLQLLSDDGGLLVSSTAAECTKEFKDGKCECKNLVPGRRAFRATVVTP